MLEILFVCTGNTCRSPLAEYLLKQMLEKENIDDFVIKSAGINIVPGSGVSPEVKKILVEEDIEIREHRVRQVDEELITEADIILTMTETHKDVLQQRYCDHTEKIYTLKGFAGSEGRNLDIEDPFGHTESTYRETKKEIREYLDKLIGKWDQLSVKAGKNIIIENNMKEGSEKMKVAIGSDHAGYYLKREIEEFLEVEGINYEDMGTDSEQSVDYPDYAYKVATGVAAGDFDRGILICGTGIGMSISANKVKGVKAALCHDVFSARVTREHNNSNVLTMGSRVIGSSLALEIVKTWLAAGFDGGRHQRRVGKVEAIERGEYHENE